MIKNPYMSVQKEIIPNKPILERFPFPFQRDTYRYSNNSEPYAGCSIEITPEYFEEIKLKRYLLDTEKERTYQSLPHSFEGQWEILELIMHDLVQYYPDYFSLTKNGRHWTFRNHLLGEEHPFIFEDSSSLPCEPLDFIGRHVQEDLFYLGQRDKNLYLDAGQLVFPANWSLAFDLGMDFMDIHTPVPKSFNSTGLAKKVQDFILRTEAGQAWTRLNWTITVEPILETAPETFDIWGPKKRVVTAENAGDLVYLRVEVQRLYRLPHCNGILFTIHTHLISLEELCKNHIWMNRLCNVLIDIPDEIAEYKGFISFKDKLIEYLKRKINQTA